jgi:DNA mismatch repair ATPase MutL
MTGGSVEPSSSTAATAEASDRTAAEGASSPTPDGEAAFSLDGLVSSADYSAKKTTLVLFINGRLVECPPLKRACEAVYATLLPKADKPFLFLQLRMPSEHVDVNTHPTKKEVRYVSLRLSR